MAIVTSSPERWSRPALIPSGSGSAPGVAAPARCSVRSRPGCCSAGCGHRSSESALAIARHFDGHPALTAVLYPGLPSHPGHEIAARQMTGGFSGMLSFRVAGGEANAMSVAGAVRVFKRAVSLGGVESLIEHRRSTEGPSSPVPDDLLRLSIGLEAPEDLIADLDAALEKVSKAGAAGGPVPTSLPSALAGSDLAAAVVAVIDRSATPSIIARGGSVRVVAVEGSVITLEARDRQAPSCPRPHISRRF